LLYGYKPAGGVLLGELRFGYVNQFLKRFRIVDGDVSQDLPVDADIGSLQTIHEAAVRKTVLTRCSVYASYPQPSEIALSRPAVAIRVRPGTIHRFARRPVQPLATAPVAFGLLQHPFSSPP
jgi:hypothetical protein